MKQLNYMHVVSVINTIDEDSLIVPIKERLGIDVLAAVIIYFDGDDIDKYDEMLSAFSGMGSYFYVPKS